MIVNMYLMDNVTMSIYKGIHSHLGGFSWEQRGNQGAGRANGVRDGLGHPVRSHHGSPVTRAGIL